MREPNLMSEDIGNGFNLSNLWEKYRILVVFGLVGLVLIGIGIFSMSSLSQREPAIQIIPAEEKAARRSTIFVDLKGAVEKPGVYELSSDSRLNDLLIRAGGLSAAADRLWVEGNLNLAQKLVDGGKIYIPKVGDVKGDEVGLQPDKVGEVKKININTASAGELNELWGIGEKRAGDIIKNRPYQSIEELLTRKIIPQNIYEKIKDEIITY